jgi:hypothetical protein
MLCRLLGVEGTIRLGVMEPASAANPRPLYPIRPQPGTFNPGAAGAGAGAGAGVGGRAPWGPGQPPMQQAGPPTAEPLTVRNLGKRGLINIRTRLMPLAAVDSVGQA